MAIAGRVAPVPKGDYNKNVAYKRLDCVKYLNVLYIAKKDVPSGTVITDENYWMKGIEGSGGGGSAVIDDTQSSTLTTYSSNKVDALVSDINQSVETTNTNVGNIQETVSDINNSLDNKINSDGDIGDTVVNDYPSVTVFEPPKIGEKIKITFAKISAYIHQLKNVAFTGSYTDLINKPTIPTLVNNYLTTEAGQAALDAYMGKLINDRLTTAENEISTLNSDKYLFRKSVPKNGSFTIERFVGGFVFVGGAETQYGVYYAVGNYVMPLIVSNNCQMLVTISNSTLTITNKYNWNNYAYYFN